jgi:hypothetical protein
MGRTATLNIFDSYQAIISHSKRNSNATLIAHFQVTFLLMSTTISGGVVRPVKIKFFKNEKLSNNREETIS